MCSKREIFCFEIILRWAGLSRKQTNALPEKVNQKTWRKGLPTWELVELHATWVSVV